MPPEFTQKRQARDAHNKRMANDTSFHQPDKLLEIILQDNLDGLEDFTLQMAYVTTGVQFEILSIGDAANNENNLPVKPAPLTLVTIR
ncbi:MAG: hypothetical protein GXP18_09275 [Gammaproteobacteria bacterium]|nr:hypothetical protein [Gammaproteobacteria bacterium]